MKCDELKQVEYPIEWGLYYDKAEVDEAIAELKQFAEDACLERDDNQNAIDELQAENAELKQKLEDAKASHYAESVDAGMRERRLRRALWMARAERASDKALIFYFAMTESYHLNINGYSDKEKGHTRMRNANWWRTTWLKVERKCRAKAEEYK